MPTRPDEKAAFLNPVMEHMGERYLPALADTSTNSLTDILANMTARKIQAASAGWDQGIAGIAHSGQAALENASFGYLETLPDILRDVYARRMASAAADMPENPSISDLLVAGMAQAPAMLAQAVPAMAVAGPAGLPLMFANMESRDPETGEFDAGDAVMGGLKGAIFQGVASAAGKLGTLPKQTVAAGAGDFGISLAQGSTLNEAVAEGIMGAGMQYVSPGEGLKKGEKAQADAGIPEDGVPKTDVEADARRDREVTHPGDDGAPSVALNGETPTAWQVRENHRAENIADDAGWLPAAELDMLPDMELAKIVEMIQQRGGLHAFLKEAGREIGERGGLVGRSMEDIAADSREHSTYLLGLSQKEMAELVDNNAALTTEQAFASSVMLKRRARDLADADRRLLEAEDGAPREQAQRDYAHALGMASETYRYFRQGASNAGRTLNTYRKSNDAMKAMEVADDMVKNLGGGKDIEDIAAELRGIKDPAEYMAKANKKAEIGQRSWGWRAVDTWIAGLLTSPATHLTNFKSNTLFQAMHSAVEQPMAAVIGLPAAGYHNVRSRIHGNRLAELEAQKAEMLSGDQAQANYPKERVDAINEEISAARSARDEAVGMSRDRIYVQEALGSLWGYGHAGKFAYESVLNSWKTGEEFKAQGAKGGSPFDVANRAEGALFTWPFRALGASDAGFKAMAYTSRMYGLAVRDAVDQKIPLNQRGEFVQNWMDEMNAPRPEGPHLTQAQTRMEQRKQAVAREAMATADLVTFTEELGSVGKALGNFANSHPGIKTAIAFLTTPVNVTKQGIYRTPGVNLLAPKTWADINAGGRRRNDALSRVAMGSMVGYALYEQMYNGEITGASPIEPGERELFRSQGNAPFSHPGLAWQAGLGERDRAVSYARMEPLATPIAVMSTFIDWQKRGLLSKENAEDIPTLIAMALAEDIFNKSVLQGPQKAMAALSDPARGMTPYVEQMAGSVVPAGVNWIARTLDPQRRDQTGLPEAVMARIPGMRNDLPVMHDLVGREYQIGSRDDNILQRAFGEYQSEIRPHPVLDAMAITDTGIKRVAKTITMKTDDFSRSGDHGLVMDALSLDGELVVEMNQAQREWVNGTANKKASDRLMQYLPAMMRAAQQQGGDATISIDDMVNHRAPDDVIEAMRHEGIKRATLHEMVRNSIRSEYRSARAEQRDAVKELWIKDGTIREEVTRQMKREGVMRSYRERQGERRGQ